MHQALTSSELITLTSQAQPGASARGPRSKPRISYERLQQITTSAAAAAFGSNIFPDHDRALKPGAVCRAPYNAGFPAGRNAAEYHVNRVPRGVFFFLFTVSGFAGLVYESIWSHYLKLFLGHAAYAQTLVLALFMGGMAIGSWLCSRWSMQWGNLLRGYALAEGLIGLAAFSFHPVFVAATDLAYASILPALGGEIPATLFKWTLAGILKSVAGISPPSAGRMLP